MASLRCAHCGYVKSLPVMKTRLAGLGIAAFGVFGWVSFLFAGSGHAFLICCLIFLSGAFMFICPSGVARAVSESQECPRCGMKGWENDISWSRKEEHSGPVITVDVRPKAGREKALRLPSADGTLTREQCLAAASESSRSLRHIPVSYLKDSDFCRELMDKCQEPEKILSYLPMDMRTLEICVLAVAANKEAINYVPADKRDFCKRLI